MIHRWLNSALILAFASLSVLIYWQSKHREPARPAPDMTADVSALRAEVAALRQQSAANLLLAAQQPSPAPAVIASAAPAAADPPDPREERERAAASVAEIAVKLDNTFDAEPADPVWSRSATTEATRALSSGLSKGSTLKSVECRTNLCKIESFHESLDAFHAFTEHDLLGRDRQIWNGGITTSVREQSGAGVKVVTYIAREGQGIPPVELD